jgi:hypothetical protein
MKIKSFTYNKLFSYSVTFVISGILILFIIRSYQLEDPIQVRILKYIGLLFLLLLGIVISKFLIPSINQLSALELNDLGIVDKVRNREAFWKDIKEIRLIRFRNGGAGICIDLTDKNSFTSNLNLGQKFIGWMSNLTYGTPFVIPLQYVSGSNKDIFETIQQYRDHLSNKPGKG